MDANQNKDQLKKDAKINFALISLEKAEPLSFWQRMKMAFSTSDMDFQDWQRLECKQVKRGSSSNWGGH